MTEPVDPFDLLRELDPVDPGTLLGAASSPRAQETLEQILASDRRNKPRRPRRGGLSGRRPKRRYVLILVPAVIFCLAAVAWALTRGPTKELTIGCYASANLNARTVVVAAGDESAIESCGALWRRGDFGTHRTPHLQACVLASGAIGVFPSAAGGACDHLKLPPVNPTHQRATGAPRGSLRTLKNRLVHEFLAQRCMTRQDAAATAQRELRTLNLTGWHLRTTAPFDAHRSCASFAFDENRHLVLIVPMPPRR